MKTELLYKPSFTMARVLLEANEEIRVEGGSMVGMSSDVTLQTKAEGGILKSLARAALGGESFFINTYKAAAGGGEIDLAPALPGDMGLLNLSGEDMLIQSGCYVASTMGLETDTKFSGAKGFFAGISLFMLRISGSGQVIVSSYGAIHEINLGEGEQYTVDTGHVLGFSAKMGFNVRKVGGLKSTLFSGEGLVVDLAGPGRVLLQTRSVSAFLGWLIPQLPTPSSSS